MLYHSSLQYKWEIDWLNYLKILDEKKNKKSLSLAQNVNQALVHLPEHGNPVQSKRKELLLLLWKKSCRWKDSNFHTSPFLDTVIMKTTMRAIFSLGDSNLYLKELKLTSLYLKCLEKQSFQRKLLECKNGQIYSIIQNTHSTIIFIQVFLNWSLIFPTYPEFQKH